METLEVLKEMERDEYRTGIEKIANILATIDDDLKEYEIRLFYDGLGMEDVKDIKGYINTLNDLDYQIKTHIQDHISSEHDKKLRYYDEISYQKYLLRCIGSIGFCLYNILTNLKKELGLYSIKDYINENSSLLHLVSTNNHSNQAIRKISDDACMYRCQFHEERRSSMRVNNHKNRLYCYGCGADLDIFHYLSEYEGISLDDAFFLLSEINKICIPENSFKASDEIVRKYTCASALRRYEARLDSCFQRMRHKNKTFNNYLALEKIKQERETIKRIKSNEYVEVPQKKTSKSLRYINHLEEGKRIYVEL